MHTSATQNNTDLVLLAWPASRLGEGLEVLARRSGFLSHPVEAPTSSAYLSHANDTLLHRWVQAAAAQLELEAEPVVSLYSDLTAFLRGAGPAIIPLPTPDTDERFFLLLLRGGERSVTLITPTLTLRHVAIQKIRQSLSSEIEYPYLERVEQMLSRAGVQGRQRERVRTSLLERWLANRPVSGGWMLRLLPGSAMWLHIQHLRLPAYATALLATLITRHFLELVAWWMIGQIVFQGILDQTWLVAWALLLFSTIPFQLIEYWLYYKGTIFTSMFLKQRLLYGALQLEPEEVRHQGAGQFIGLVMETDTLEQLALSGGFQVLAAPVKLVAAIVVLMLGAAGVVHSFILIIWLLITLVLLVRYYYYVNDWMKAHRGMTNDLVERMVGHRTRLAQEERTHWHREEDQALANYLNLSQRLDRLTNHIYATLPSGWLLLGLAALVPAFVFQTSTPVYIAISLGGVLLAYEGFTQVIRGVQSSMYMLASWKQIVPLSKAATRHREDQTLDAGALMRFSQPSRSDQGDILVADDITFRYPDRPQPVLQECSLRIRMSDRLLLEGPSGGGKSTLAAILIGLRQPQSGLILLWNYDRKTAGSREWRRRVVAAPQFHENHVLTETLAFNLLMGRRWPPTWEDFQEAEVVCRELGLGELLERMPSGLQQMVGEGGWQLSHGERSRLYIARALLQEADLIVLDESFAALDPENLQRSLECVLKRAPALLVIAHP